MFMERVSDQFSKSPHSSSLLNKTNDVTITREALPGLTTGNFAALHFSVESLERAKKMLESPDPSQSLFSKIDGCQFRTGTSSNIEISAEALSRAQKLFDSPSQLSSKEDKEKQTEEIEKKSTRNGLPIGIRAGIIRHGRGELSCNSSIQPKFINVINNSRAIANNEKRRIDSPPPHAKSLPKQVTNNSINCTLIEMNKKRPLKGFFNSSGLLVTADNAEFYVFSCNCYTGGCSCSRNGMKCEDFYDILIQEGFKCTKEWVAHHYRLIV